MKPNYSIFYFNSKLPHKAHKLNTTNKTLSHNLRISIISKSNDLDIFKLNKYYSMERRQAL